MIRKKNKAIFLDKDGTLLEDVPYNVNPALIKLQYGALEGLRSLKKKGFLMFIISNQSGVALGYFALEDVWNADEAVRQKLADQNISLDGSYYCPHHPHGNVPEFTKICNCRKPEPGMLLQAAEEHQVDLSASWMIGDILNDVEAGNRAGCKTILIENGNETEWRLDRNRIPDLVAANLAEAAQLIATINHLIISFNPELH